MTKYMFIVNEDQWPAFWNYVHEKNISIKLLIANRYSKHSSFAYEAAMSEEDYLAMVISIQGINRVYTKE